MKKVPVLFIIFCREEVTLKTFASIKEYKPDVLYVAADGPRIYKTGEDKLCEETRNSVLNAIDWDCDIKTLFHTDNLGCTKAVIEAITWFLSNEDYGVIVEDDCFIHQDFYKLCEQVLPLYLNEEKIMMVTSMNPSPNQSLAGQLAFSTVGIYIWGWATWKRAWNNLDVTMKKWPQYTFTNLVKNFGFIGACFFKYYWNRAYHHRETASWDTVWVFDMLANNGLCVSPNVNLSKNLGIEIGGAHYEPGDANLYSHIPFGSIKWPIVIPENIEVTKRKLLSERKEFIRIRRLGLIKKLKKTPLAVRNKLFGR